MTKDEAQRLLAEHFGHPDPHRRFLGYVTEYGYWTRTARDFAGLASRLRADSSQNEPDARHWDTLAEAARVMAEAAT